MTKQILIVDDEQNILISLEYLMRREGYEVRVAKDGEEGLRIAQDRLAYWLGVGAQASDTVERLAKQAAKKAAA